MATPLASLAVAENCCVLPFAMLAFEGETLTVTTTCCTVTSLLSDFPPALAVAVAVPFALAVARPVRLIETRVALLDEQVIVGGSGLFGASKAFAEDWFVSPIG